MSRIAVVLVVLAMGLVGYWVADGYPIYNVDRVQVETMVKDEIFGTETPTIEWKDEYHPGLVGPIGIGVGILLAGALALFVIDRRAGRTKGSAVVR